MEGEVVDGRVGQSLAPLYWSLLHEDFQLLRQVGKASCPQSLVQGSKRAINYWVLNLGNLFESLTQGRVAGVDVQTFDTAG